MCPQTFQFSPCEFFLAECKVLCCKHICDWIKLRALPIRMLLLKFILNTKLFDKPWSIRNIIIRYIITYIIFIVKTEVLKIFQFAFVKILFVIYIYFSQ